MYCVFVWSCWEIHGADRIANWDEVTPETQGQLCRGVLVPCSCMSHIQGLGSWQPHWQLESFSGNLLSRDGFRVGIQVLEDKELSWKWWDLPFLTGSTWFLASALWSCQFPVGRWKHLGACWRKALAQLSKSFPSLSIWRKVNYWTSRF